MYCEVEVYLSCGSFYADLKRMFQNGVTPSVTKVIDGVVVKIDLQMYVINADLNYFLCKVLFYGLS